MFRVLCLFIFWSSFAVRILVSMSTCTLLMFFKFIVYSSVGNGLKSFFSSCTSRFQLLNSFLVIVNNNSCIFSSTELNCMGNCSQGFLHRKFRDILEIQDLATLLFVCF